jgi:hypothetical protein
MCIKLTGVKIKIYFLYTSENEIFQKQKETWMNSLCKKNCVREKNGHAEPEVDSL